MQQPTDTVSAQATASIGPNAMTGKDTLEGASQLPVEISVVEGDDRDTNYAIYELHLKAGDQSWVVERRYSEFEQLRNDLESLLTSEELDSFPPKHLCMWHL